MNFLQSPLHEEKLLAILESLKRKCFQIGSGRQERKGKGMFPCHKDGCTDYYWD